MLYPFSSSSPWRKSDRSRFGDGRLSPRAARSRLCLLALALLGAGCGTTSFTIVKPHQRELLADRIMRLDGDAQERSADQHMLANREGAVGGNGTSGGGCGCN